MTRRRSPLAATSTVLLLTVCGLSLTACHEGSVTMVEEHRINLVERLSVAEVRGEVERLEGRVDEFRSYAGSEVVYYFPVPAGARLVGAVAGADDAPVHVEVDVTSESGDRQRLLGASVGSATQLLEADLSAYSGEMLGLRLLSRDGAVSGAYVDWRGLRIEGSQTRSSFRAPRRRYNILLILFDSLRADQTAPYGALATQTPRFGAFADEGVTFVNARSNSSWTRPAVASMLTAVAPSVHGVLGYDNKLGEAVPYLPEILQMNGYRTLAVSKNLMVSRAFGLFRGFESAHSLFMALRAGKLERDPERQAEQIWSRYVEPELDAAGSRPFFIYLHELSPHSPYDPPEPYASLYEFGYQGHAESTVKAILAMRSRPDEVHRDDVRHLESLYRGEVAFLDRYLSGILDALAARGLEESTIVILVSDHGEEFWDHGSLGHGHTVYEEQLRVPFLMRLPGVLPAGLRVETGVGLMDLAPTLLELVGIEVPDGMQGESLLSTLAFSEAGRLPRASFGYSNFDSDSVVFGRWKLIRDERQDPPKVSLFDLVDDPSETLDVAAAHPIVLGALEQMRGWQLESAERASALREGIEVQQVSERVRRGLEALGYVDEPRGLE